jgi:hypothetical protein
LYTEDGMVKVYNDQDSAQMAQRFPEVVDGLRRAYTEVFEAVKDIRVHSEHLSKQYTRLYEQIVNLDVLQKEWAWVEEDFNILHGAQGFIKMSNLYTFMADAFYDCIRRRLTFTGDLCRISYQELWDQR